MRTDRPETAGGGARGGSGRVSTGKAKAEAAESKLYDKPVKGSGKPKYQGTVKPARVNTQTAGKDWTSKTNLGTNKPKSKEQVTAQSRAKNKAMGNIPKTIDREVKELKGQRTASPSTPKVPVKKKGK